MSFPFFLHFIFYLSPLISTLTLFHVFFFYFFYSFRFFNLFVFYFSSLSISPSLSIIAISSWVFEFTLGKLLFANCNAPQLRGSREVSPVAWRNFFVAHYYRSPIACSLTVRNVVNELASRIDFNRFCRDDLSGSTRRYTKNQQPRARWSLLFQMLHTKAEKQSYFTETLNNERTTLSWLNA